VGFLGQAGGGVAAQFHVHIVVELAVVENAIRPPLSLSIPPIWPGDEQVEDRQPAGEVRGIDEGARYSGWRWVVNSGQREALHSRRSPQ